jgi:hypothetical protein
MRLRFVQKPNKSAPLRDGTVDLETGVVGKTIGPEVRAQGCNEGASGVHLLRTATQPGAGAFARNR